MQRKVLLTALVLILACGMTIAASNRDRDLRGTTTSTTVIGTCEPESDSLAFGWDKDPTSGSWGGLDESQFAVVWEPGAPNGAQIDVPDYPTLGTGRFAACTIAGMTGKTPTQIEIKALAGLANDDYCVFASVGSGKLLLVGCYDETSTSETWITTTFALPAGFFASGQDVTVWIQATGNAWPSFSTWGQLGVDFIRVSGN